MNRFPVYLLIPTLLGASLLEAKEKMAPNLDDRLERLIYITSPDGHADLAAVQRWQAALDEIPDANERMIECVEYDYLESNNSQQLGLSMSALGKQKNLLTRQWQRITKRLAGMKSPDPERTEMDDQFICGGLHIIRNYPSIENEKVASSFLNDNHPAVLVSAAKTLAAIGGPESQSKVRDLISRRREAAKGLTDPIVVELEPALARFTARLNEDSETRQSASIAEPALDASAKSSLQPAPETAQPFGPKAIWTGVIIIIGALAAAWLVYVRFRRKGGIL